MRLRIIAIWGSIIILFAGVLGAGSKPAHADKIRVTTFTDLADLARHIGGGQVEVTSLATGVEDTHGVPINPSFVPLLNRADLLVLVGLGCEHAFLPALLEASKNPRIQQGKPGSVDMETLAQILSPDFLLRNSVYTSVLVGFACPLVGVFLVMRRLVFMGVALPQISSTGVAIALSLPLWFGIHLPDHGAHSAHALAFAGSMTFSLTAILVLAFLERRGRGQPEGRLGTAYVVSASLSILLLSKNPHGEIGWLDLLKGEVITVSNFDLILTAATLLLVLTVLRIFHKELLLVSFDREMAITLRKNVVFWDILLYLLIGLTVSMAVLSVGPLIAFGFLLIPALTAHLFAHNIRQFALLAASVGGTVAFLGFWLAYQYDLPVGPADVVLLGGLYAVAWVIAKLLPEDSRYLRQT